MDFRILGPLEVIQEGDVVDVGAPRLRLLLALLLIQAGEAASVDRLIDDLWEGEPPKTARHTLQGYVYRLRRALGPDGWRLETRPHGYQLKVAPEELDSARFLDLAERGREALADGQPVTASVLFQEALDLWRGDVFADLPQVLALEPEHARLEGIRKLVLEDRLEADLAAGEHGPLAEELGRLVVEYPYRERLWGQLMVALYRAGRQADALAAFQRARQTLGEELGIEPSPWLTRLEEQILLHHADLGGPEATELSPPTNLPAPRTSFVGRSGEITDLAGLVATRRLVTVVGPPGSGKTRLATETATRSLHDYSHGVWFVSLAEIEEPDMIASVAAATLGVWAPERPSRQALVDHVKSRRMLLVLDNFEHLLRGADLVSEVLDAAPGLRVLATSRAPLRLSGEQLYELAPMPVPDTEEFESATNMSGFDGVQLFVERARLIDPHFTLTPENGPLVGQVVARVDGLPLGIELAAARLRMFTLGELTHRLDDALTILSEGAADAPARQRRLTEAIAWSHDLLSSSERALFRRLGIFRGGFTAEAAEAVGSDGTVTDVVAGLSRLIEMSLVQGPASRDGPARYQMLETIRQHAFQQLAVEGEDKDVARRHAYYYTALAEEAEPELTRIHQSEWLQRLETERANLLAVLRWAKETGQTDLGLALAGRIWRFWQFRGPLTEGRTWLEDLLAASSEGTPAARAKGLIGLAGICYWQADLDRAEDAYREVLDLSLQPEDWWLEFGATLGLAQTVACHRGLPEEALPLEEHYQSLVVDHPEEPYAMAYAMATSALIRLFLGNLEGSRRFNEPVVEATRQVGERWLEGQILHSLGLTSLLEKRFEQAENELRGSLEIAWEGGDARGTALILERLGQAAAGQGEHERGVTLAGAASRIRDKLGVGLTVEDYRWELEDPRDTAKQNLTKTQIDIAWAKGRTTNLDETVTYAGKPAKNTPVLTA